MTIIDRLIAAGYKTIENHYRRVTLERCIPSTGKVITIYFFNTPHGGRALLRTNRLEENEQRINAVPEDNASVLGRIDNEQFAMGVFAN